MPADVEVPQQTHEAPPSAEPMNELDALFSFDSPENYIREDGSPLTGESQTGVEASSEETPQGEDDEAQPSQTSAPTIDPQLVAGVNPDVVVLMEQIASADELDVNDPKILKMVRRIAEGQFEIQRQKLKEEPSAAAQDYLSKALALFEEPQQQTQPGQTPPSHPAADEQTRKAEAFVERALAWATPEDAGNQLYDVFNMEDGPERNAATVEIFRGLVYRELQQAFPALMSQVEQRFQPVVETMRYDETLSMREEVLEKLQTIPELKDVKTIFELVSREPLELNGKMVPDSWCNRVLKAHPAIMDIKKGSEKATMAARYDAILRVSKMMRQPASNPAANKALIDTGRSLEQSKNRDFRQGLNGGRTQQGTKPSAGPDKFADFTSSGSDFDKLF